MMAIAAAGGRLRFDRFLTDIVDSGLSRNLVQAMIRDGRASINDRPITDPAYRLRGGEVITFTVSPPDTPLPQPQASPFTILYEDDEILVLDKPAGLVVHPAPGNRDHTLVNALVAHCGDRLSQIGGRDRRGIVHRLDRDVSGVMVVAKTDRAHLDLAAQFADHGRTGPLARHYRALIWGVLSPPAGSFNGAIGRHRTRRTQMAVVPIGRHAITHYKVLAIYGNYGYNAIARVDFKLETGRTHQIRVHTAHAGHAVLGDRLYGEPYGRNSQNRFPDEVREAINSLDRLCLYAHSLDFRHPLRGDTCQFKTKTPVIIKSLTSNLESL